MRTPTARVAAGVGGKNSGATNHLIHGLRHNIDAENVNGDGLASLLAASDTSIG